MVLLTGCDKTTPALLMGAASCDVPALVVSGGPMLNGRWRDETIGSGTHVWKFKEMLKTGEMNDDDLMEAEQAMSRSAGHCMTMGTASTMASMVEALGMALPTNAAIPAVDSRRYVLAHMAGRRIVQMVKEDLRMSKILTKQAFENAIRVNGAIGGSTNAVVHLLAIARRIGVKLTLDDWDRLGRDLPCLVNLMPSGEYLMEDFYYAGGLPVVIRELGKGRAAAQGRAHRERQHHLEQRQGGEELEPEGDLPDREAVQEAGRHRRAARQPGAEGRGDQAFGRHAEADEASRPCRGVREHRGLPQAHRRSEAEDRRDLRHGAEGLRAEGLSGLRRRSATWPCPRRS